MAKKAATKGMHKGGGTKARGRSSIKTAPDAGADLGPRATRPNPPITVKAEANRPVSSGGKHRGDRRDMSRTYSGVQKHAARGSNPRQDVSTRKR